VIVNAIHRMQPSVAQERLIPWILHGNREVIHQLVQCYNSKIIKKWNKLRNYKLLKLRV